MADTTSLLIADLDTTALACNVVGWDGYDALPADPLAVAQAKRFVRLLPVYLPLPSFCIDPDGAVSLDWGEKSLLSISIDGTGRISWAQLNDGRSRCGTARLEKSIPKKILQMIRNEHIHTAQ